MIQRLALILITLFWVTMNFLLWRSEYGQRQAPGTPVDPEVVWQKMLTAPDSSSLSVFHHRKKIGFCHWITSVGEELSKAREEDAPPEGMVGKVADYRLALEGNVALPDAAGRVRFDGQLKLDRERTWQDFHLRLNFQPVIWEIRSRAADGTVVLSAEQGEAHYQRLFRLSDLENPDALLRQLLDPMTYGLLRNFGLGTSLSKPGSLRLGLQWEARHDTTRIAHSLIRTYRLQARVLDRYSIVLIVSRVGEILRIELPNELILVNDQLGGA
jgi:hypothetical protein